MSAGKGADLEVLQKELFALDPRYRLDKIIGAGSYGVVLKGVDTSVSPPEPVAIKKISKLIFQDTRLAKRILREVKLLSHFHKNVVGEHSENIIGLKNLITPDSEDFKELWIIMELAESDLKSVFRSGQKLSLPQTQFMLYQMLQALLTLKAAGVIHRDITPANVLVSYQDLDIKICDFGLAREEPKDDDPYMTDYVTMRWYRAPELVMESKQYTEAVDMWGVGCILAEMLGSKPLFRGVDRINQLDKIIEIVGSPKLEDMPPGSKAAQRYVKERYIGKDCKKGERRPVDWAKFFPISQEEYGQDAIDLLSSMLQFCPDKRIIVEEALRHPFLRQLHDPADEDVAGVPRFDFSDENMTTIQSVKQAIFNETMEFHHRNPHTMTREMKAKQQHQPLKAGSDDSAMRTGFEMTVNPQEAEEDVEFNADAAKLPAEIDVVVDTLSNIADEHRSATMSSAQAPLEECVASVLKAHPKLGAILSNYGYIDGHFTRDLNKSMVRQLIKEIRDAFTE
eukprot:TRINITY_DN74458_c0_g1_i1.p1 TRINITY_DN74458_c0_g1~~TRINITY_DN74458_c0_g1_i1.p1  ORF type:complete len:510 (+),score=200.66 TRINITY_DN74458_c0_g1_i1:82-1611(+)